ncbi:MAG: lysozyme [Pseudomonadota bacterium]
MPDTKRKRVFDAIRSVLKRGFRQSEVDTIDRALDQAMGETSNRPEDFSTLDRVTRGPSLRSKKRRIGPDGVALIKGFEGCARLRRDGLVEAYPDPGTGGDPWTIGWGATGSGLELGSRIGPGTVWTQKQCDIRLADDLTRYARDVAEAIGEAPTTQKQFDAMVSFHYNTGAIGRATLTKKHVAGDYDGAAEEFKRWNKAGGRVLKGLVRRRAEEARLYRSA